MGTQRAASLRDLFETILLGQEADYEYTRAKGPAPVEAVKVMTLHAAKGLEFPIVFLVGLEDGIFPHSRSINDPKELEEERRLAYVAITRAKRVLYVSHSMRRRVYGEEMAAEPSQFLNEMPLDLMEDLSRGNSWLSVAREGGVVASRSASMSKPARLAAASRSWQVHSSGPLR